MILCVSAQAELFMVCAGSGFILGFSYDIIRILRRLFRHNFIVMAGQDFLYWCVSAVFIFMLLLCADDGKIRLFNILGIFLGMIIYFSAISDFIVHFFTKAVKLILFRPAKFLMKLFNKLFKILLSRIKKIIRTFNKPFKNKKQP